ncbi:hypothetical protein FCR2A7T_10660 [Flavobacterium cauense R2A-7]|uniref:Serine aminopeptidase S33 domain-containing protein n=1 Tax=Flavobacterium cauense R2A-7 TaxID=1341154 RepID=V6S230_9FLAO|nr:alpha/beta hydrolase [Flavobacterium cauense]ESU20756.1 hypothetical protein FCR2A7T_10660 [Flavobacterium cauense R2A-7]KGO82875.1 hypothetical protein Q762_03735 [Flavobacterium cauense R2A-7]TWI10852.1 hypothetical protein IP98_02203 [Flavobacterium cauense R2A-7]
MKTIITFFLLCFSSFTYSQNETFGKEEIIISSLLKGDLYTPEKGKTKKTLVILLAGSGPTNRNGNQIGMQNNSLKYLAEDLANGGYSVFTFDKRIIAQIIAGNINESESRFEDLISDAKSIAEHFKQTNNYKKIVFAGHSEGSLVGMIAAREINANAYISISGAGRSIDEVLIEQLDKQLPSQKEKITASFNLLKKGETFKNEVPVLESIFRASVQPYLISWIKYNPQEEIQKLNCPILIINGDNDLQVEPKDALLLNQVNKKSELVILKNMNHVFKTIKGDKTENMNSYSNPNLKNAPELSETILKFLNRKL